MDKLTPHQASRDGENSTARVEGRHPNGPGDSLFIDLAEPPLEKRDGKKVAIVYVRVSDDGQDVNSQRHDTHRVAETSLASLPVVEIADDGESAFHQPISGRPGGRKMLSMVENGEVAAIIVQSQDRLSRHSPEEAMMFIRDVQKKGVRFFTRDGERRYDSVDDSFTSGILAYIEGHRAWRESYEKQDRAIRGRREAATQGRLGGGKAVQGMSRGTDGVLRHNETAPHIVTLFERFDQGWSIEALRGLMFELTGERWTANKVKRTLDHPAYIGKLKYKGEIVDGLHEALIPLDLWERVQQRRNDSKERRHRDCRRQPFSSSVLRCGDCGGVLTHSTNNLQTLRNLKCLPCRNNFAGEFVEISFLAALQPVRSWLERELTDPTYRDDVQTEISQLEAERDVLQSKRRNLVNLVADGDEIAKDLADDLRAKVEKLDRRIGQLSTTGEDRRVALARIRDILAEFASTDTPPTRPKPQWTITVGQSVRVDDEQDDPAALEIGEPVAYAWSKVSPEERHKLVTAVAERIELFGDGRMRVKLHGLSRAIVGPLPVHRRCEYSKALRQSGFSIRAGSSAARARRPQRSSAVSSRGR